MSKTKIEWSDEVWNPVTGCTPVSEGCHNCYAKRMAHRLAGRFGYPQEPHEFDVTLRPERLEQPLRWVKPRRVFICSMSDFFHPLIPLAFQVEVFSIIRKCPQHTFLLLTKRTGQLDLFNSVCGWPDLDNLWLGVSVENQAAADERREDLERCPAAVKFVSYEPALGPVDWTGWEFVSQIISGGESGPGARPSHPDWHRATRDFCQENEIAYFFKGWGAYLGVDYLETGRRIPAWARADGLHKIIGKWPEINFDDGHGAIRVGKKRAGHLLDGREWQEFPV